MRDGKKIAVVGPKFFGYAEAICKKFNEIGTNSTYFDELPSNNNIYKSLIRVSPIAVRRVLTSQYQNKILIDFNKNYNTVVFISPETIAESFLANIKNCKKVLYLWDTINNKPENKKLLKFFDKVISFDIVDCKKYKFDYLPLFSEDYFFDMRIHRKNDLCVIGSAHSDRILYLERMVKRFDKVYYYLYSQSKIIFLARNPKIRSFLFFKYINTKKISKSLISKKYNESKVVLDIAHTNQHGFTSRSYEALACGCLLVTNMSEKFPYPEFEKNIYRYKSINDSVTSVEIAIKEFNNKSNVDIDKLTLTYFCKRMLSIVN